jgi:hypothetical protein
VEIARFSEEAGGQDLRRRARTSIAEMPGKRTFPGHFRLFAGVFLHRGLEAGREGLRRLQEINLVDRYLQT